MNLNYDSLRTFSFVAAAPSFQHVAKSLFISVSAVSQQMKTLEAQLGYALFERVGRRARLTEAGAALAAEVRDHYARIDEAVERAQHTLLEGVLTIGSPRAFASHWLLPRLLPLLSAHEALRLNIVFDVPSVLERRLGSGELDACLLARGPELGGIASRAVAEETFVAVASPSYLRKYGKPRVHADFLQHRYAIFDRDMAMHAPWWRAAFGPKARMAAHVVAEAPSLDALLQIALTGVAIVVLPRYFVTGRLVELSPPSGRLAQNTLHLCWRQRAAPTAKLQLLLDLE